MEYKTSANISEDRKVILSALREVPEEITFMLSEAEHDTKIPNRYWFEFPAQWVHQQNKDPIIGIRSIYTTNTNRFIRYNYKVELFDPLTIGFDGTFDAATPIDKIEGTITHFLDGSETIRPITENFNKYWLEEGTRTHTCSDEEHTWKPWEIQALYAYSRERRKTYLRFGRGLMEDKEVIININGTDLSCPYRITITPLSDDAKALFGIDEPETAWTRVEIPIWSRYNCLVKSSLASNDKNNILGHTRSESYTPIKYYRLNQYTKKFWIELYETRFHDSPVVFPIDKRADGTPYMRDDLIIEAIVCFTAQAML